ncbi:RecQ family ATP-dependent DNA helicase [Babesia caballi]|uniref:RecQ family ATP-dependent DNA helicase n=1 Tax=Babesia caballi TaxID=5871 RepID=A0AAV4LNA1_BABCB|nr:RecQ family ATP-dependent DNA helicase [Babesia caballi]
MVHISQGVGIEYDVKSTQLPEEAELLGRSGAAYIFAAENGHYVLNEQLESARKIELQHKCFLVSTFGKALALAARNRLYVVDEGGVVQERKTKKRFIHIQMINEKDVLQVLICRSRKMLHVQLGDNVLALEAYGGQCDCEVLFGDFVEPNVFCLAYRNEGKDVTIALIAVMSGQVSLIRKDRFREAKNAKMSRALACENAFLMDCDGELSVLSYDPLYCSVVLVRRLAVVPESSAMVRLVDHERLVEVRSSETSLRVVYHTYGTEDRAEATLPLEKDAWEILAVDGAGHDIAVLLKGSGNKVVLLQFKSMSAKGECILFDNKVMVQKPKEELSSLIRMGKVTINSQLVDHIMENKLESCAIECLKSIYIPEKEAVRIIVKDTALLKVLIRHTKGDHHEMISAVRQQVSKKKCAELIEMLLHMIDNIDMFGSEQMHCYKRIVAFTNILLDAKILKMQEADMLKQEWIDRLKHLVQHCTTENHNLQSLLSFTTSLLKTRGNRNKSDKSSLIVSLPISV